MKYAAVLAALILLAGSASAQSGSISPTSITQNETPTFTNAITGLAIDTTYECRMWVVCDGTGFWVDGQVSATTNASGKLTFQAGGHQFTHVEDDKEVRLYYGVDDYSSNYVTVTGGLDVTT